MLSVHTPPIVKPPASRTIRVWRRSHSFPKSERASLAKPHFAVANLALSLPART